MQSDRPLGLVGRGPRALLCKGFVESFAMAFVAQVARLRAYIASRAGSVGTQLCIVAAHDVMPNDNSSHSDTNAPLGSTPRQSPSDGLATPRQDAGELTRGGSPAEAIRKNWESLSAQEQETWRARARGEGGRDGAPGAE